MASAGSSSSNDQRSGEQPVFQLLVEQAERGEAGIQDQPPAYDDQGQTYDKPPLLVKLTGYRLLTLSIIVVFGTVKAVKSLENDNFTATWLEWVAGALAAVILYWIGLYEKVRPEVSPWFFHVDYTRELLYLPLGSMIFAGISLAILASLYLYRLGSSLIFKAIPLPTPDGPAWKIPVAILLIIVLGLVAFALMSSIYVLVLAGLFSGIYHLVWFIRENRELHQVVDVLCAAIDSYWDRVRKRPVLYAVITIGGGLAIAVTIWTRIPTDKLPYNNKFTHSH